MSTLLTVKQVKSLTVGFAFPETYDMSRVEEIKIYLGKNVYPHTIDGKVIKCQIKSDDTAVMYGANRLSFWLDDSIIGVYPIYCGDIVFEYTNAIEHNESVNTGFDLLVNMSISETSITVGDVMYNYVKGGKGDPFVYDDFTPEQIAELQQPATDAISSIEAVEQSVEQAEALRVKAEQARQTNTATAIQNAENATTNAGNAASLANAKAGLANDAALLANEKAGLAATAATQANDARDGANSAEQSATNLVNSYATDLAAKELKANKQNSLAVDGTGTKFPTVDAVNAGLASAGNNLIADYTHSANTEIIVNSVDVDANTFISANHGLTNNTIIYPTLNDSNNINVYPLQVYSGGIKQQGYYVVNKSDNTFQISATASGAPIDITSVGDLSKWHFEISSASAITFTGLNSNRYRLVVEGKNLNPSVNQYLLINDLNMTSTWMTPVLTTFTFPFINVLGMTLRGYLDILVEVGSDFFTTIRVIGNTYNVNNNNAAAFTVNTINNTLIQSINGQYSNITQLTFNDNGRLANGAKIKIYKL